MSVADCPIFLYGNQTAGGVNCGNASIAFDNGKPLGTDFTPEMGEPGSNAYCEATRWGAVGLGTCRGGPSRAPERIWVRKRFVIPDLVERPDA